MKNRIIRLFKRNLAASATAVLVLVFLSVTLVQAATTISTNISTGGTLSVTGASSLSADLYSTDGALFNIASSTAFLVQNGSGTNIFKVDTTGAGTGISITGTTTITQAGEASRGLLLVAGASGRQNLLENQNSSNAFLSSFTAAGGLFMNIASATAVEIQSSGTNVFRVVTNGANGISAAAASTTDTLTVGTNSLGQLSVTQGAAARKGIGVKAAASASDNLLEFQNSSGTFLSAFTAAGGLLMNISSTTALTLQNAGVTKFVVDTTNGNVGIGLNSTAPVAALDASSTLITTPTVQLRAADNQTANLFQLRNNSTAFLSAFTAAGGLLMNISSTTALTLQNGSGTTKFVIDSATGNATSTGNLNFNSRNPFILWNPTTAGDKMSISSTSTLASLDMGGTWVTKGPQTQNGSPDVAEYILTRSLTSQELGYLNSTEARRAPGFGDIVAIDKSYPETAVLATKAYSKDYLGIIADGGSGLTNLANLGNNPQARPLALAGRVRVKVTSENGVVKIGDLLTASATKPGYAMKATKPGYIIGKALDSMTSASDGLVMVFISNIYAGE